MLEDLMGEVAKEWELESSFTKTPQGSFRIPVEDAYVVLVSENDTGEMVFTADIAKIPLEKKEECFQMLLNANLLGQGTAEFAVLGIDPKTEFVKLHALLPLNSTYDFFLGTLEEFIVLCDYWRDEILSA